MTIFASFKLHIYLSQYFQVSYSKNNNVFIFDFNKYTDFKNIFLLYLASQVTKYIRINNYIINFIEHKYIPYKLIYILFVVKLETLKTYINNNLTKNFVKLSQYIKNAFISFIKKFNFSFY